MSYRVFPYMVNLDAKEALPAVNRHHVRPELPDGDDSGWLYRA
jgi:hypothetical protein